MKNVYPLALATSCVVTLCGVGAAQTASASVGSAWCNGRSDNSVVTNYYRGNAARPIRCGTTSWGFRHVTQRWNAAYDAMMRATIARGESVGDAQGDGGTQIYAAFDGSCHELFRVIYNGGSLHGTGVNPQGVITAYYIDRATNTLTPSESLTSLPTPGMISSRSDCPVYQNI